MGKDEEIDYLPAKESKNIKVYFRHKQYTVKTGKRVGKSCTTEVK